MRLLLLLLLGIVVLHTQWIVVSPFSFLPSNYYYRQERIHTAIRIHTKKEDSPPLLLQPSADSLSSSSSLDPAPTPSPYSSRRTFLSGATISALTLLSKPWDSAQAVSTFSNPTPSSSRSSLSSLSSPSSSSSAASTTMTSSASTTTATTTSKTWQETVSGAVAGGALTATKTVVKYPLDTATVRLQLPGTPYSIRQPLQLLEGAYRGIVSPLVWNVPGGAIFFAVKDSTKSVLEPYGWPKWASTSLAVAVAQVPYWLIRNPSEVVKTQQQSNANNSTDTTLGVFGRILEKEGILDGFYKGYWENILYAYPADVLKFVVYDVLTGGGGGGGNLSPTQGAVAGAIATGVAQFCTTPLDVVRNRIMTNTATTTTTTEEKKTGYLNLLVDLGRREGLDGLFAGAIPRVGKAILSGAIQFATYEETKQKLNAFFLR